MLWQRYFASKQHRDVQTGEINTHLMSAKWWADPTLSPDDVKCRLIDAARPALDTNGNLAYSSLQQGAGMISAYDAVNSTASGCANRGMDITADLNDIEHYGGPVNQDEQGNFYLMNPDGGIYPLWDSQFAQGDGYVISNGYLWNDGYVWNDSYFLSSDLTDAASTNVWVGQE